MEPSAAAQAAQLLPLVVIAALTLWMAVRILHKAGYSGWWSLLTLIPFANIVMLWVFAFSDWPALKDKA